MLALQEPHDFPEPPCSQEAPSSPAHCAGVMSQHLATTGNCPFHSHLLCPSDESLPRPCLVFPETVLYGQINRENQHLQIWLKWQLLAISPLFRKANRYSYFNCNYSFSPTSLSLLLSSMNTWLNLHNLLLSPTSVHAQISATYCSPAWLILQIS